tara:strand:- start:314 stop:514 length:201 start_codon:yes stop_codon:yes gene_type:complete
MTELTQEQAVSVLVQAAKIAQAKGAFTLEDASVVASAIKALVPEQAGNETDTEATAEVETAEVETV